MITYRPYPQVDAPRANEIMIMESTHGNVSSAHTGGDGADLVEYFFLGGRPCDRPQSLFQCATNDSIALLRAFTELNVPHRIRFRVKIPFQISI